MTETIHVLHTAKLKNNCPECYDKSGLELTFTQLEKENKIYSKASSEIDSKMFCSNCNTTIYPVSWDDDIERVFQYNKKMVQKKPTGIKLKPLAYIIILIDVITIALLIYFLK